MDECFMASCFYLKDLHVLQSELFWGVGVCPPDTLAAWLDNMRPVPTFKLCVNIKANTVDDRLKTYGVWQKCPRLAVLLNLLADSEALAGFSGGCAPERRGCTGSVTP